MNKGILCLRICKNICNSLACIKCPEHEDLGDHSGKAESMFSRNPFIASGDRTASVSDGFKERLCQKEHLGFFPTRATVFSMHSSSPDCCAPDS